MQIFRNLVSDRQRVPRTWLQSILRRGALFALIWWILVDGVTTSWWIGIPAVLLVSATSVALLAPVNLVWHEMPGFLLFFFTHSLLGGADVAWRAVHPGLPIAPDLLVYPLRLPPGLPQVFMANTISLLPGTLSVELDERYLNVHVLNGRKDIQSELEKLERKVAALFGSSLPAHGTGH